MIYSDRVPLTEPVVVPDIFVSGLARIEEVGGGNLRFTFFTNQRSTDYLDERPQHTLVLRFVMHVSAVRDASQATEMVLEGIHGVVNDIVLDGARH